MTEPTSLLMVTSPSARRDAAEARDRRDALELLRRCFRDKTFDEAAFEDMVPFVVRSICDDAVNGMYHRGDVIACAFAGYGRDGRPALHWVAVHQCFRRQGFAREVCQRVLENFEARGVTWVTVRLTPPTPEALALYRSLGFKEETNG